MSLNNSNIHDRPGDGNQPTNRIMHPPVEYRVLADPPDLPSYLDYRSNGRFSIEDYTVRSTEEIVGRGGLQPTDRASELSVYQFRPSGFPSSISPLARNDNRFSLLAGYGDRPLSASSSGSMASSSNASPVQKPRRAGFIAGSTARSIRRATFDNGTPPASSSEASVAALPTYASVLQSSSSTLRGDPVPGAHQSELSITSAPRQVNTAFRGRLWSPVSPPNILHRFHLQNRVEFRPILPSPVNGWAMTSRPAVPDAPANEELVRDSIAMIFRARSGTSGAFQPSHLLHNDPNYPRSSIAWPFDDVVAPQPIVTTVRVGNSNYGGHGGIGTNQDDELDEELNCAIWIMRIHPNAGIPDLLDAVRNCGRVFSCWLNEAQPPRLPNGASKLVFTTRKGYDNFMAQAHSFEGIRVFGQLITAQPNRSKYRENSHPEQSRVIRIYGPGYYNNREVLDAYFGRLFFYHTCSVVEGSLDFQGYRNVVWTFGSILSQSQAAKKAIESEPAMKDCMVVDYLPDPCE